jgi:hypothetical protein
MNYATLKTIIGLRAPQALSGGMVNITSGSPVPEIALYAHMTNMEIAGNSHKFSWALREATITLTGATDYNLATLIPDLAMVYQIPPRSNDRSPVAYQPLQEFNILFPGGGSATIINKTLRLSSDLTSGSMVIPYYSNYFVATSGGTRQQYFTDDTDVSILPEEQTPLLVEGIMRFIYAKQNVNKGNANQYTRSTILWDGRVVNIDPFPTLLSQAILADSAVARQVYDYRIIT